MIALPGHLLECRELQGKVRCPKCGTAKVQISFHAPVPVDNHPSDAGRRQMRPARSGEWTLGTCTEPWIVVLCEKCNRRGEYKRETLLARYGPDMSMPSLHQHIAADAGCGLARGAINKRDLTVPFLCGIKYDVHPVDRQQ